MKSISNDHPSAYYRCDYEPFVCFIMALNLRGLNECWNVKPCPPRLGRSQGLFTMAHRVLLYTFLLVSFVLGKPCTFRIIHGLYWDRNESDALKNLQRIKHG